MKRNRPNVMINVENSSMKRNHPNVMINVENLNIYIIKIKTDDKNIQSIFKKVKKCKVFLFCFRLSILLFRSKYH